MTGAVPVGIGGVGFHVPERVVDNQFFTRFVDTSDAWIRQRTGIRERRWLKEGERPSDMFAAAGRKALERAGVSPEEVDMLVVGSVTGDYTVPSGACVIQDRMGLTRAAAFDVAAACSGFLYALAVGQQFIASGACRRVLVMGGEALSRITDLYDRGTCVLFGDGAGAALLQPWEECGQGRIEATTLGADGSGHEFIIRPKGGGLHPMDAEALAEGSHLLRMRGREVYRTTVAKMAELVAWALDGTDHERLGLVIPHQMNARILETITQRLHIPSEKVYVNIERYGNTSAGTIPIALAEAWERGLLEKDRYVVLAAFGAGLTWGAARILW